MKLHILAIGHKMPGWIETGVQEYIKRMPPDFRLELHEIKPEARGQQRTVAQVMQIEAQRVRLALPKQAHVIALDERGEAFTSQQWAQQLQQWQGQINDVAFVIGGADGLEPAFKQTAQARWQLSALTLPHGLVRVMLVEQLYRAVSILKQHPYHRE